MKKNNIAMISVTFILGAVFGISLIAVLSFVKPLNPPSPDPALKPILVKDANRFFHNYYDHAGPINDKIKGFMVDRPQLEAMNELAKNPALFGFRIYIGKSDQGDSIGIVAGAKNIRLDDVTLATGMIYRTESRKYGPCPPFCDKTSLITK